MRELVVTLSKVMTLRIGGTCLLTGNLSLSKLVEHKDITELRLLLYREVTTFRDNNITTDSYEIILRNSRYRVDGVKVRGTQRYLHQSNQ